MDEQKKLQMHLLEELICCYLICPDATPEKEWITERIKQFEHWFDIDEFRINRAWTVASEFMAEKMIDDEVVE